MIELSRRYHWLGLHLEDFDETQMKVAYGFLVLGPVAKTALPELISMLNDPAPEVRALASFAIGKIGPEGASALPALQRLITNSVSGSAQGPHSTDERVLAAFALGEMGSVARPTLPQLELLRKDSDIFVRGAAEAAFVKISGRGLDAILEPLKDASSWTNWTNWQFAARATTFLGTNGIQAIPFLIQALQCTNSGARDLALESLGAIHMSPEITVPAILPLIAPTNTKAGDRATALAILRNLGTSARAMVPTTRLLQALQDTDGNVRAQATNALRQIDPEAARKAGIDSDGGSN
jgi:HEAT repeat protein